MKNTFGGIAIVAAAILLGTLAISEQSSAAEVFFQDPQPLTKPATDNLSTTDESANKLTEPAETKPESDEPSPLPASAPANYLATAYSLRGRTASGRYVSKGIIAADPRVLPLGSRVRIEAGSYSGEYLVADTGGLVRGKRIDIWTPSTREALRFGKRTVKLTVLSYGVRKARKVRRPAR